MMTYVSIMANTNNDEHDISNDNLDDMQDTPKYLLYLLRELMESNLSNLLTGSIYMNNFKFQTADYEKRVCRYLALCENISDAPFPVSQRHVLNDDRIQK